MLRKCNVLLVGGKCNKEQGICLEVTAKSFREVTKAGELYFDDLEKKRKHVGKIVLEPRAGDLVAVSTSSCSALDSFANTMSGHAEASQKRQVPQ
jgi:hypothetical protein